MDKNYTQSLKSNFRAAHVEHLIGLRLKFLIKYFIKNTIHLGI